MSPPPRSQSVSQSPLTTLSLAQFPRLKRSRYPSPLPALSPPGKAESTLLSSSPKRNRRRFRRNSRYRCRYQRAEVHTVVTVVHAVSRVLTLLKQSKEGTVHTKSEARYLPLYLAYLPPTHLFTHIQRLGISDWTAASLFANKGKRRRGTTEFLPLPRRTLIFFSFLLFCLLFFSLPLHSPDLKLISVEGDFKTVRTRNVRKSEERAPENRQGRNPVLIPRVSARR